MSMKAFADGLKSSRRDHERVRRRHSRSVDPLGQTVFPYRVDKVPPSSAVGLPGAAQPDELDPQMADRTTRHVSSGGLIDSRQLSHRSSSKDLPKFLKKLAAPAKREELPMVAEDSTSKQLEGSSLRPLILTKSRKKEKPIVPWKGHDLSIAGPSSALGYEQLRDSADLDQYAQHTQHIEPTDLYGSTEMLKAIVPGTKKSLERTSRDHKGSLIDDYKTNDWSFPHIDFESDATRSQIKNLQAKLEDSKTQHSISLSNVELLHKDKIERQEKEIKHWREIAKSSTMNQAEDEKKAVALVQSKLEESEDKWRHEIETLYIKHDAEMTSMQIQWEDERSKLEARLDEAHREREELRYEKNAMLNDMNKHTSSEQESAELKQELQSMRVHMEMQVKELIRDLDRRETELMEKDHMHSKQIADLKTKYEEERKALNTRDSGKDESVARLQGEHEDELRVLEARTNKLVLDRDNQISAMKMAHDRQVAELTATTKKQKLDHVKEIAEITNTHAIAHKQLVMENENLKAKEKDLVSATAAQSAEISKLKDGFDGRLEKFDSQEAAHRDALTGHKAKIFSLQERLASSERQVAEFEPRQARELQIQLKAINATVEAFRAQFIAERRTDLQNVQAAHQKATQDREQAWRSQEEKYRKSIEYLKTELAGRERQTDDMLKRDRLEFGTELDRRDIKIRELIGEVTRLKGGAGFGWKK